MKGKFLAWLGVNAVAITLSALAHSDLWTVGGSDALLSIYRVPVAWLIVSLIIMNAAMAYLLFTSTIPVSNPRKLSIKPWIILAAMVPCLLSLHMVTVGAKDGPAELSEYLGPIRLRSYQAAGEEGVLSVNCKGSLLTVQASDGRKGRIWLGLAPWALSKVVCSHPLAH